MIFAYDLASKINELRYCD